MNRQLPQLDPALQECFRGETILAALILAAVLLAVAILCEEGLERALQELTLVVAFVLAIISAVLVLLA